MNLKILCQNLRQAGGKKERGTDNEASVRRYRFQWLGNKYDLDIVCMQEVNDLWKEMLRDDFREEYDMYYLYRGSLKGSNEAEPVMWKKEKYEKLEEGSFWLSETPDVPGSTSWQTACPRICTWGIFKHKASGKVFAFVNTHLDHRSLKAKENGIKLILDNLSRFKNMPIILTGDFNSRPQSNVYQATAKRLSDARHIAEKVIPGPNGTFHGYKFDPAAWRVKFPIDYIFVDKATVKVKTFQVINDYKNGKSSSDHFPVKATVVF